jgi:hypothetical protein
MGSPIDPSEWVCASHGALSVLRWVSNHVFVLLCGKNIGGMLEFVVVST